VSASTFTANAGLYFRTAWLAFNDTVPFAPLLVAIIAVTGILVVVGLIKSALS